jgi:LacI family transcriptional regulator
VKPSLKIIADKSGVSKTTVSFVLNGRGDEKNISAETQQRVLETAKMLDYVPNHLARSLSMGRSFTIGFIVPDISNPFFGKIARLVEHFAEKRGYSVMVASTDERPDKEKKILETFINRQIDGIIIAPVTDLSDVALKQIPLVCFDRIYSRQAETGVAINNKETAQQLTQSLVNKGHQRISLVALSSQLPNIQERITGYKKALVQNGIDIVERLIVEVDEHNKKASTRKVIKELLDEVNAPTGYLFLNNVLAAEAIWTVNKYHANKINGLHFASFDNLDLFDYALPKVISALQPGEDIARNCVDLLCYQIDENKTKEGFCLSTKIIER